MRLEWFPHLQYEKQEGVEQLNGDGVVILPHGRTKNQTDDRQPTGDQCPTGEQFQAEQRAEDGFHRRYA
jgi:hypothetical protein